MTPWTRRSFLASAGTLATVGGVGAAAGADGETREVPLMRANVAGAERRVVREVARRLAPGAPLRLMRSRRTTMTPAQLRCGRRRGRSWAMSRGLTIRPSQT